MDKEGGIKIGSELQRTLGQIAKDTGFSREELETFSKEILIRFIGKAYGMRQVSLTMSDPIPKKSDDKK